MRVLVTGAQGFIGGHVAAALAAAGHDVVPAVRTRAQAAARPGAVVCDFTRDLTPEAWLPRLDGIDAVVNCAGILREERGRAGRGTFDAVHRDAPAALFTACARKGVRKVVQVSALGDPAETDFIRSKHAGDAALMELDLDWVVVRPSLVWSPAGSYGGTSLIRALAALPLATPLAGGGGQPIQPITAEDLGRAVAGLVDNPDARRLVLEAVGPETVTFAGYVAALRAWMGYRPARPLSLPKGLVRLTAAVADRTSRGPLGATMATMLDRGNVGQPGAYDELCAASGHRPARIADALAASPAQVQDRWHARLYFLRPLLRVTLALVWIVSGLVGFLLPVAEAQAMMADLGVEGPFALTLAHGAAGVDVALGLSLLLRFRVVAVAWLMVISVAAYTVFLGVAAPDLWLHPYGPLLKNLVLVPALLVMAALEDQR